MRRLRTRVTVVATVVDVAIMSLAAVAMIAVQQRQLAAAVDASLTESAVELSTELDVSSDRGATGGGGRPDRNAGVPDLAVRILTSNRPIQLLDTDGGVLASSYALAGVGPLVDVDDVLPELSRTGALVRTVGGGERPYRVIVTALDSGRLVLVGYSLADVEHALEVQRLVLEEAGLLRRTTTHRVGTAQIGAARVRGDASQRSRVIRNLADNAARHARSTVAFELAEHDDGVVLAVSDDGRGVDSSAAEAIFDRFRRLDESRHRDAGGSGLGLAICREIVERHHGTIGLDLAHRNGARFVVRLPPADHATRVAHADGR